jgi:transcriptional regulator with XRE-family HTH domain
MRKTRIRTMHDLASVARGRRIELGLTQAELASRSGVSRDWVNSFERGKRTVDISLVFRLFDALSIGMVATDAAASGDAPDGPPNLDALLDQYYNR